MSGNPTIQIERRIPTRKEAVIFRCKTLALQGRRAVSDLIAGRVKRATVSDVLAGKSVIARSSTPLWTESEPEERALVAGKIQNLRAAAERLNGAEVAAGEIFSFWKHVGRATKRRGFVAGRELREGCIIPNIGGGLCQLSNALYDAALQANFEIIERHRHTQVVSGSLAEVDRDATVFWNYVDLRFRSSSPFRIDVKLDGENLTVEFRGERSETKVLHQISGREKQAELRSCATCGVDDCHRVTKPGANPNFGSAAWLADEYGPEFDAFIQSERTGEDMLCIPMDGRRFRKNNYAWNTGGFGAIRQSLFLTGLRSYHSRKLASQGAGRQQNLLKMYEALAARYARQLRFDALHVTVQQNLLPFLWRSGHLGGRTFDVLMTALPMAELQKRLDHAAALHPESTTLGDFRADAELVGAEAEALAHARRIITPHTDIAALFREKAKLLDWASPKMSGRRTRNGGKPVIIFPASTVGRKGCYELREAVRGLDVKLLTMGPYIEAENFWSGFDAERAGDNWLETANVVVLPAFVEHKPKRLIAAARNGIPVVASHACGVSNIEGVTAIPAEDVGALNAAIKEILLLAD
jgi:hypothetical protein